jgi:hypothetical protein
MEQPTTSLTLLSQSVWYRLEIPTTASFLIRTTGSTYEPVLALYRGGGDTPSPAESELVASTDESTGPSPELIVVLERGSYFLFVGDRHIGPELTPHMLQLHVVQLE